MEEKRSHRSFRRSQQREEGELGEDFRHLIKTLRFVHFFFYLFLYSFVPVLGTRGTLLLCFVPSADAEVATSPTASRQSYQMRGWDTLCLGRRGRLRPVGGGPPWSSLRGQADTETARGLKKNRRDLPSSAESHGPSDRSGLFAAVLGSVQPWPEGPSLQAQGLAVPRGVS